MLLHVSSVDRNGDGTVWTGIGRDDEGEEVTFAGDWRPMEEIALAIERGEEPEAEVPDWAVIGRRRK